MAGDPSDIRLRKQEKGPLDRFKNQNLLLKKFGDDGLKVYGAIGTEKTSGEVLAETGISEERFVEILEFMDQNGIIGIVAEAAAPPAPVSPAGELAPEQISQEAPISPEGEEGISPVTPAEEEIAPIKPKGKEKREEIEEIAPIKPKARAAGEEAISPAEERPAAPAPEEGPIRPSEKREAPAKREAPEMANLSPLEKIIYGKYGKLGVQVYNLIDGEKTAEEILVETGISEVQLVEMLEFMDNQGIIKLEKPQEEPKGEAPPAAEEFRPMLEEKPENREEAAAPESGEFVDIVPIDIPAKAAMNMLQDMENKGRLLAKFGNVGVKLYELIDAKRDMVDLATGMHLSLYDIDMMLNLLGKRGTLLFRPLTRDEVKKRYGEDGFTIYKRYGRDGILLYELIGKEASIKDIILSSRMEPERGVEIFMFIHKVLGLEIPFDKSILYKQLGLS